MGDGADAGSAEDAGGVQSGTPPCLAPQVTQQKAEAESVYFWFPRFPFFSNIRSTGNEKRGKKMIPMRYIVALAAVILGLSVPNVNADPVYGTDTDIQYTGSRSVGTGLIADPSNSKWSNAAVEWTIEVLPSTMVEYTYYFTGFKKKAISHIAIDLTDDAFFGDTLIDPDAIKDIELTNTGEDDPFDLNIEYGNVNLPAFHKRFPGGVKIEVDDPDADVTLTFLSNRLPTWGHLVVKGAHNVLYNSGFDPDDPFNAPSESVFDFVARPNGPPPNTQIVPLPAAAWPGLALLGFVGAWRMRRHN